MFFLRLYVRTSASPRQQRSDWGLRVTQNANFSLITRTKQLLLVTLCDTTAGIGASFWTTERQYRTRANKWRSRSVAAPLTNHAKSHILCNFYVVI